MVLKLLTTERSKACFLWYSKFYYTTNYLWSIETYLELQHTLFVIDKAIFAAPTESDCSQIIVQIRNSHINHQEITKLLLSFTATVKWTGMGTSTI